MLDESELQLRVQERQKLFKDYRTERQGILEQRNLDREARNEAKVKQLEQAEQWQVSTNPPHTHSHTHTHTHTLYLLDLSLPV